MKLAQCLFIKHVWEKQYKTLTISLRMYYFSSQVEHCR